MRYFVVFKSANTWEQRELGEVCKITMGQSPDGSTYSDTPTDYILVQGNADLKDGWVCPRIWTTQKTKTADAGDLIMSVRAPAGAMGKTAYDVVLGRGVAGIKGNELIYQLLVKMDGDGYWKKLAAGSTFESINSDAVTKAEIVIPQDIAEQQQIGAYFRNLDNLIALHQRSYNLEQKSKTTNAWEQRELGECFDERTERSADGELIAVTINSGVVKASELNRHDNSSEDKSNYKVVRVNDIAYNSMRMWQGASGYSKYDGILSPAYTVVIPRENVNPVFFSYMFKRTDMIHEFQINSQGLTSDTWNLKFPAFSTISANVPKSEEQQAIGNYFTNLDNLITLHQRNSYGLHLPQGLYPSAIAWS